jgi:mannose-6-phosphate isomerase-like protein (cupin superfamily)
MQAQQSQKLQVFNLKEYRDLSSDPVHWQEIYNGETIRAGIYLLKAGAKDDQKPHEFDEIYWIEKGVAKIRIGENDFNIKKGDVIYVQAQQVHYFHDITEDLEILVLFSKGPYDSTESIFQIDPFEQLALKRDNSKNVWSDFLKKKSMTFGLCMLPKTTGRSKPLTHPFDEINFVLSGKGSFTAGSEKIEVEPGSLFYVSRDTPHYIITNEGMDVLILFENKSLQ